jgi:hypothetical protein
MRPVMPTPCRKTTAGEPGLPDSGTSEEPTLVYGIAGLPVMDIERFLGLPPWWLKATAVTASSR